MRIDLLVSKPGGHHEGVTSTGYIRDAGVGAGKALLAAFAEWCIIHLVSYGRRDTGPDTVLTRGVYFYYGR